MSPRCGPSYGELLDQGVRVVPFIEDMAEAYAWADLVLCRAGALTVAELAIMGGPRFWCRCRMRSTITRPPMRASLSGLWRRHAAAPERHDRRSAGRFAARLSGRSAALADHGCGG